MKFKDVARFKEPFIIAEVGSNWFSLEDCLKSIRAAKGSGADAVKFQLFNHKALYGVEGPNGHALDPLWLPELKAESERVGIEFMCSAFSPQMAIEVNPYVNIHKVASSEMYHKPLLDQLNRFSKPVVMSTAASTLPDIQMALACLPDVEVCLMYCVCSYPAKDVDLRSIELLKPYAQYVGYSDHTTDVRHIPVLARLHGSSVIEKHFKAIDAKTPDSEHSLNPREFGLMVNAIRNNQSPPYLGPQPDELDAILKYKRRLKVIRPIRKGDILKLDENYGSYRSLQNDPHAIAPFHIDKVEGKMATRNMIGGDGIGPTDFE